MKNNRLEAGGRISNRLAEGLEVENGGNDDENVTLLWWGIKLGED